MASMTDARTQPEVVHPVTSTVSTPLLLYQPARLVPKKPEGCVLRTTYSPLIGASSSTIWLIGASSVRPFNPGAFSQKIPLSEPSSE